MRARLTLALMLMWVCSAYCLAGEFLMNEEAAYGLRVVFSEPVTLTWFGDVLIEVDPMDESNTFLFSGAQLPAWAGHGLAWTPASARITSYEWLSQQQVAAIGVVSVPLTVVETFPIALTSRSGETIDAIITRTVSQEQVPFVVEYSVDLSVAATGVTWTDLGSSMSIEGSEAQFVFLSNAEAAAILLEVETEAGTTYSWTDEIDFLLHNKTEIALDATQFVREEEIASVQWSAANGDPDDARTFPIADPTATTTTLVSEWPNVLDIRCDILRTDGTSETHSVESLVYFRDGTPFEIRSAEAYIADPLTEYDLARTMDEAFETLSNLGFNTIQQKITWYFGYPDKSGVFTIEPLFADDDTGVSRGFTPYDRHLRLYFDEADREGFRVSVQMRVYNYLNDASLVEDYPRCCGDFLFSRGFLYGAGQGREGFLLEYIDLFLESGVDEVTLAAEIGSMEYAGGIDSRAFFTDVITRYRNAGFSGELYYAMNYSSSASVPMQMANLNPKDCGIPWATMDSIGVTFYPRLAGSADASTGVMYEEALRQLDLYLLPMTTLYGRPIYIAEMFCVANDGCAILPLAASGRVYDPEEQRRWSTALLRALAWVNITGSESEPPIRGVTLGVYRFVPNEYMARWDDAFWREYQLYLNDAANRPDLQHLAKVFYRDVPLEGGDR